MPFMSKSRSFWQKLSFSKLLDGLIFFLLRKRSNFWSVSIRFWNLLWLNHWMIKRRSAFNLSLAKSGCCSPADCVVKVHYGFCFLFKFWVSTSNTYSEKNPVNIIRLSFQLDIVFYTKIIWQLYILMEMSQEKKYLASTRFRTYDFPTYVFLPRHVLSFSDLHLSDWALCPYW